MGAETGKGFNVYLSFADLLGTIVLMLLVLMGMAVAQVRYDAANPQKAYDKATEEYFSRVDVDVLQKGKPESGQSAFGPGESALYVTVKRDGSFAVTNQRGETETVGSDRELSSRLRQLRPSKLYLRVDRMAPFGAAESVILEAQSTGIVPYLAAREEG